MPVPPPPYGIINADTAAAREEPFVVRSTFGVTSEVGRLRTVLLHRPADELKRLTPRNNVELLFDGLPWLGRAQEEHDAFAAALRSHGVEVLYLVDLLVDALGVPEAREEVLSQTVDAAAVGPALADVLAGHLAGLPAADLAEVLTAGLSFEELGHREGRVARLHGPGAFVVPPLPNLLFTRDSSVWVGEQVAVTSLSTPARQREATLTRAIYSHHPRFAGAKMLYGAGAKLLDGGAAGQPAEAYLEGGDVLLLAPGVVAVGVGERTTPSGAEALAQRAFAAGVAHTVLAVPIAQQRATMHLDTVCTMVDVDAVVMYPPVADRLNAFVVTPDAVTGPEPFLVAAAKAMGIDTLHVLETGLDPVTAEREQWDDGNNTLAIAPRLVVAYERNEHTNARLEDAGIEVIRIAGSELGSAGAGPDACPARSCATSSDRGRQRTRPRRHLQASARTSRAAPGRRNCRAKLVRASTSRSNRPNAGPASTAWNSAGRRVNAASSRRPASTSAPSAAATFGA